MDANELRAGVMRKCESCGAEVYEDSDQPVTAEWLVNNAGFDPDDFGPMLPMPIDARPIIPLDQGVIHVNVRGLDVPRVVFVNDAGDASWFSIPVPTRGHVRRLCAALGVELREAT